VETHSRWVDNDVWDHQPINNRAPRAAFHACPSPRRRPFFRGMLYGAGVTLGLWAVIVGMFYFARG